MDEIAWLMVCGGLLGAAACGVMLWRRLGRPKPAQPSPLADAATSLQAMGDGIKRLAQWVEEHRA